MNTLAQIAIYIINSLGTIYIGVVLLRFLLQVVRANYYNPISKSIAKFTNPLLVPLRKIIPGLLGIDLAALVLAILLQALLLQIILFLIGFGFINPIYLFLWSVVALLGLTLNIYFVCTIVVMIASWIAPYSDNPALTLMRQLLDPLVAPFRRILPPLGGLDLSFMVFFLALQVVRIFLLPNLAALVSMPTRLMLGF